MTALGSKNKLKRFKENETFTNVFQPSKEEVLNKSLGKEGQWAHFFGNNNPIVLELGCGKGEYTVGLAKRYPNKNFIGIDIKGARFWRGAKTALEETLPNVAFIRTQIELVEHLFFTQEVAEIWITFPDPQIKYRRRKKRLTAPDMLEMYRCILADDAVIHLKTDSQFLYGYTLGIVEGFGHTVLDSSYDIDRQKASNQLLKIKTNYEGIFRAKGMTITYLKFQLSKNG